MTKLGLKIKIGNEEKDLDDIFLKITDYNANSSNYQAGEAVELTQNTGIKYIDEFGVKRDLIERYIGYDSDGYIAENYEADLNRIDASNLNKITDICGNNLVNLFYQLGTKKKPQYITQQFVLEGSTGGGEHINQKGKGAKMTVNITALVGTILQGGYFSGGGTTISPDGSSINGFEGGNASYLKYNSTFLVIAGGGGGSGRKGISDTSSTTNSKGGNAKSSNLYTSGDITIYKGNHGNDGTDYSDKRGGRGGKGGNRAGTFDGDDGLNGTGHGKDDISGKESDDDGVIVTGNIGGLGGGNNFSRHPGGSGGGGYIGGGGGGGGGKHYYQNGGGGGGGGSSMYRHNDFIISTNTIHIELVSINDSDSNLPKINNNNANSFRFTF